MAETSLIRARIEQLVSQKKSSEAHCSELKQLLLHEQAELKKSRESAEQLNSSFENAKNQLELLKTSNQELRNSIEQLRFTLDQAAREAESLREQLKLAEDELKAMVKLQVRLISSFFKLLDGASPTSLHSEQT